MKIDVPMMFLFSLENFPCEMIISFMGKWKSKHDRQTQVVRGFYFNSVCLKANKKGWQEMRKQFRD